MENIRKLTLAAVLAALTCVATIVIQIPMPLTNGYINMGDCIVLVCGWMLGARYGFAAAGIGSALADLITGYAHYAPATLIIKGLMAVVAVAIYRLFKNRKLTGLLLSSVAAELIMVTGYFLFSWLLLGSAVSAAASSIIPNAVQGLGGIICGVLLEKLLEKSGVVARVLKEQQ